MEFKEFAMRYWLEAIFGVVAVGLGAAYRQLAGKIKKQNSEQQALRAGMLALLRSEIIRNYDIYINRKWIPIYAMENVLALYNNYHVLGGNGTMTKLVEELKELSSNKPKEVEG